jgi:hypothetical protein
MVVWLLPVLLAGYPATLSSSVNWARQFARTGVLPSVVSPLFTVLLRVLLPFADGPSGVGWAAVSAGTLALALIPLWWSIARVFHPRLAWVAVILFSFMPMHWHEAVGTGYYPLALLCLFSGFALFLFFSPRHRWVAVASLGLCYGLVLASTHAFFTLLPWFVCVYLFERRKQWRRAFLELAVCSIAAYVGFVLPLLPMALQPGRSISERLAVLLPFSENLLQPSEVYGDDYAYRFLRKEIDDRFLSKSVSSSFIERRDTENFRVNYHIGSAGIFGVLMNGCWLFANALASLFMQETVGGVFLWLFIVPGLVFLYRTHRRVLLQLLGLWLSMELVLRFGFHYARIHLMDVGWVVAIISGAGVLSVADVLHQGWKRCGSNALIAVIILLVCGQMAQENRRLLAQWYSRSTVPRAQAVALALKNVSSGAVIAQPRDDDLLTFTDRNSILLQDTTIDILATEGKVADPFRYYHITHIILYDPVRSSLIRKAAPWVRVIALPVDGPMQLTPFKRYLLNLFR